MARPTWPSNVDFMPFAGSYSDGRENNRRQFEVEAGPPLSAKEATSVPEPLSWTQRLTGADCRTIQDFFRNECNDGVTLFEAEDPELGVLKVYEWAGFPSKSHIAGDIFEISINVERQTTA